MPGLLPGPGGRSVAVEDFGLVLVPRGGGAVRVEDEDPAPLVDDDLMTIWWWKKQSKTQSVVLVVPPCFLCLTWCTSQTEAGWLQPPGNRQCRSRRVTALRIPAGIVSEYPMSSGRLGPARRTPSCRRRRKEASPPGPDSRSTALPTVLLMHTAGMSTSAPRHAGGAHPDRPGPRRAQVDLARSRVHRPRAAARAPAHRPARPGGEHRRADRPGDPRERRLGFKRQRVELPDGTFGYRVVRPEWEKILTALRRGSATR